MEKKKKYWSVGKVTFKFSGSYYIISAYFIFSYSILIHKLHDSFGGYFG